MPARGPGPIRASVGPALQRERDRCCNTMLWSAVAATFVLAGESKHPKDSPGFLPPLTSLPSPRNVAPSSPNTPTFGTQNSPSLCDPLANSR